MNPQIAFLLNKSLESLRNSNLASAELYLKQAIRLQPNNPHALRLLGVISAQQQHYPEALNYLNASLKFLPKNPLTLSNLGNIFLELKEYNKALDAYDKSIKIDPTYAEAWSNKGNVLSELERYDEAITQYDKALILRPDYAEAWSNKGNVLSELERYDEAITQYDKALILRPDYAEAWSNKGKAFTKLKRYEEALSSHENALILRPDYAEAWSNKGLTLFELKRYEEALSAHEKAVALKPDYAEAWSNKGLTLFELKRYEEALSAHEKAVALKPDYYQLWINKGVTLYELKHYDEVVSDYEKALSLKSNIDWFYSHLVHAKMKICSLSGYAGYQQNIINKVLANEKITTPFAALPLTDNAFLQKKSSEIYAQDKYPFNPALGAIAKRYKKEKIRIGYFSADFRNHPVAFLTSELFEIHDRDRFEVFAFSLHKAPDGDEMSYRLRKGFDRFVDVQNMSDLEIAELAREFEIDIAIDLSGPTQYSRTGIFSYRAAPIQVNWLGYPGTIGAQFIDYIVADRTIIPKSSQQFYIEKVVYLPDTYMVDDSKRVASSRIFTREECGLPENAFIFCCFNSEFKFNPQLLDSWTRILLEVDKSVLWISENNKHFRVNITAEFEMRGIDPSRIIFAKRVESMADHLARYALADLFLDTHPYNAHTTAVDSLKVGVPVLTLKGESFASRVASSLLRSIGLPELVTTTWAEYEALAIDLATHPEGLGAIRENLKKNRFTTALFDTPLFAKNLESAYIKMYERYEADLQVDHIYIP